MDNNNSVLFTRTIGDTTYVVMTEVSENAKETAYEKVKKLILNELSDQKNKAVS